MPSWIDRYETHEVWSTLEELRTKLKGIKLPKKDPDRDTLEWCRAIAERIASYRKLSNPIGYTKTAWDSVESYLRLLIDAVDNWTAGVVEYEAVDAAIEAVVTAMAPLPSPTLEQETTAAVIFTDEMSKTTSAAIEQLTLERNQLSSALAKSQETVKALAKDMETLSKTVDNAISSQKSKWDRDLAAKKKAADVELTELSGLKEQAHKMVHEVTADLVGTEYADYAKEKQRAAFWYDVAAALVGLIGLGALLAYLLEKGNTEGAVSLSVTRLGITAGALVIAGSLAARGTNEHAESKAARRTALALSRMAPFITNLPVDAQQIIIIETADRIFTKGELENVSDRTSVLEKIQEARRVRRQEALQAEEDATP